MQPLFALLAAAGAVGYPFLEARWFRVNHLRVPLGRDVPRTTILHVSDTHLVARNRSLIRFLTSLPGRFGIPDLILATGDLIEDNTGITPITRVLNDLPARLGRFYVLGSHDYYQSRFQSYSKYFTHKTPGPKAVKADTSSLERSLQSDGWVSLTNRTHHLETKTGTIRLSGVDDPYLDRHTTEHIDRAHDEVLAIGLAHAPNVVSEWVLNGFDLVVCGHTHAGQVRLPGIGALVTNSSLPNALAGGLHRIGSSWLHVSPGLGTGRFTPIRFNCRPEVTLLEITL
jgi:predicted MPP superfamily phosphohydrolase